MLQEYTKARQTEPLDRVEEKLDRLMGKVEELSAMVRRMLATQEQVVVLRTLSREDAKEEIVRLFESGDVMDYEDLAQRLQLDLRVVVDICRELASEGVIEELL